MFTKTKGGDGGPTIPTGGSTPTQDAIRSASSKPAARAAASIICSDMAINGSISSEGALQVDGKVDGDVVSKDITVGASGIITGEVKAEIVIVKGTIRGSIRARKVELETGCKVEGDIVHTSLAIQANAVFEGQVKHAADPLKETGPRPQAATSSTTVTQSAPSAAPVAPNGTMGQTTGNA